MRIPAPNGQCLNNDSVIESRGCQEDQSIGGGFRSKGGESDLVRECDETVIRHFATEGFVAPKSESVSAVNDWLSANGVKATTSSPAGDWLRMSVPVSKANDLLGAQFSVFTNQDTGKQSIQTLSYSIPASLQGHIELIHPTTRYDKFG